MNIVCSSDNVLPESSLSDSKRHILSGFFYFEKNQVR